ncbi:Uncharacterised protein [Campylobacter helveticus]|nr:Uncharacterised protein [Campylobacter helveticus]
MKAQSIANSFLYKVPVEAIALNINRWNMNKN